MNRNKCVWIQFSCLKYSSDSWLFTIILLSVISNFCNFIWVLFNWLNFHASLSFCRLWLDFHVNFLNVLFHSWIGCEFLLTNITWWEISNLFMNWFLIGFLSHSFGQNLFHKGHIQSCSGVILQVNVSMNWHVFLNYTSH